MKRWFLAGLVLAFLAQTGIVAAMVWSRVSVLRSGQEIAVRSTFVDPRDIFRGHYVRLQLTVVPADAEQIDLTDAPESGEDAYVTLREGQDGFWVARAVSSAFPADTTDPVLKILYVAWEQDGRIVPRLDLPHDRYFADYDRAQELENLRREQKLGVVLALDGDGGSVIKGLTIDGERVYDEPLL